MAMPLGNAKAQINVTPMIDVLLVLIIIFMVITPTTSNGLKTLVPQPAPPDNNQVEPPSHDIVITIRSDRTVRLNQEPVELANLPERLARLFRTEAVVFVRGDKDLNFSQVAEVIDIARGAGLNRIALMTQ